MDVKSYKYLNAFLKGEASQRQRRRKRIALVVVIAALFLIVAMVVLFPDEPGTSTPEEQAQLKHIFIIFVAFWVCMAIATGIGMKRRSERMKRFSEYELETIDKECEKSGDTWISIGKTAVVSTYTIIPTKDIVWAYWSCFTQSLVVTSIRLVLVTRDRKSHIIDVSTKVGGLRRPANEEMEDVFMRLSAYRPHLLYGNTARNRELFKKGNFPQMVAISDGFGIAAHNV